MPPRRNFLDAVLPDRWDSIFNGGMDFSVPSLVDQLEACSRRTVDCQPLEAMVDEDCSQLLASTLRKCQSLREYVYSFQGRHPHGENPGSNLSEASTRNDPMPPFSDDPSNGSDGTDSCTDPRELLRDLLTLNEYCEDMGGFSDASPLDQAGVTQASKQLLDVLLPDIGKLLHIGNVRPALHELVGSLDPGNNKEGGASIWDTEDDDRHDLLKVIIHTCREILSNKPSFVATPAETLSAPESDRLSMIIDSYENATLEREITDRSYRGTKRSRSPLSDQFSQRSPRRLKR